MTAEVFAGLKLPSDDGIATLRTLPVERVVLAYTETVGRLGAQLPPEQRLFFFAPVLNGHVINQPPLISVRQGSARDVDIILGTDVDETEVMRLMAAQYYEIDDAELSHRFTALFGEQAGRARTMYRATVKRTGRSEWMAVDADRIFLMPMLQLAQAHLAAGRKCWAYLFARERTAIGGQFGAFHTLEVPFVFNRLATPSAVLPTDGPPVAAVALAMQMHHSWIAFARTGDPNHGGISR